MAIKFSQFNLRTDHTSGMYLVGYDGNQNIHITVDNLFDDFINGTENTITMFGTDGTALADSILSQDAGATILTVSGQLNVDAAATFDTSITVTSDSTLNGNVTLGNASADLITQTGTLYLNGPVKDTTDTLGAADQVLLSDATGELTFTDLADLHVGGAEVVEVPVKNVQGSALVKGDPVYISGSVGASGKLEVQLADASNTLKMPAVGLLKQDLANNAEGFAVVTGKLRNLITDPIDGVTPTENDVVYVKPSGTSGAALTTTKPVYGNFIQNIGKVGRVSTSNDGNLVVSSILRTNDIPNLTPGRLWVGSTGNTIESQTLFVDEASGEVGIGTASPSYTADIVGTLRSAGQAVFADLGPVSVAQLGGGSSTTSQFDIISTAGGGSFISATNRLVVKANNKDAIEINNAGQLQFGEYGSGTFTGTAAKNLSIDSSGNVIETNPAVDGSGTLNYVTKWTPDGNTLGNSIIYDNGTQVGVGTASPAGGVKLQVEGHFRVNTGNINIINSSLPILYLSTSSSSTDNYALQNSGGNFQIKNVAGLGDIQFQIRNGGQIRLDNYGSQAFTGTAAYNLSVDSSGNIIETDAITNNNQLTNGAGYLTSASLPAVNNGTLTLSTSAGLDGGASFTANQSGDSAFTVSLDLSELTDMTGGVNGANDELILLDSGAERRKTINEISLSQFDNDLNWTSNSGDITSVIAGNALTGGGTFGNVTLNLSTEGPGAGTYGSSSDSTKIDNITIDAYGRIQGVTTGTTGSMSSWTIKEGNGTETASVTNGETLTIAQGTGIQSEMTSTSSGGTIQITNTAPNVSTNLSTSTSTTSVTVNSSDGSNATIGEATGSAAGVMSTAHHNKLDGIAAGATNVTNNNQLTNGAGYTTNTGDITGVTAGSYMTGGGASGTVTLNANASTSATANTLAARTSSGDIYARLLRATYQDQSTISGAIAFRVNNGTDNYTRYCNSPSAIRTFIGAGTSSFSGSYNDLSNKPTIPTNNNQLTNGAGYITGYSETDTLSSVVARGSSTSSRITAAGLTATSDIRGNGQQLVLNAGESASYATGQTAEHVYLNAEGGVQIVSSPNNWSSGWAGRRTAVINDSSGNSSLPGNLTLASTEAKIKLTSTSSNPSNIIQATQPDGSAGPPMGELRWDNNPSGTGMRLIYYSGYSENSLKLDGTNFIVTTGGSERMRINSSGNVGIGTTNPSSAKLQVESTTSTTSSGIVRLKSKTAAPGAFVRMIDFVRSNNSTRGYIAMNQYSVQYNTTSDYRLKRNVTPMENSIDRIKLLKPSRFNWVEGPDNYVVDGFIAHEVQDVVHDAVSGEKDAVDENNEPAYQGIDQSKLVPLLTAALQDAITKIEDLETRIQTLENN